MSSYTALRYGKRRATVTQKRTGPSRPYTIPPGMLVSVDGLLDSPVAWLENAMASLGVQSQSQECIALATAQTAPFDAKTSELSKNWNPSGFYSPAQVLDLVKYGQAMLREASSTVDREMAEPNAEGSRNALTIKTRAIQSKFRDSLDFTNGAHAANAKGIEAIDAPGLKRWIVNSMTVASDAMDAVAFVSCMKPWWVGVLAVFQRAFDALVSVAKAIGGVAVSLGKMVLEIPDTLSTLWTYGKYAAIVGAAYLAITEGPNLLKRLKG